MPRVADQPPNHFSIAPQVTFYLHQFLTTRVPARPAASPGSTGAAGGSAGGRVPSMQQLVDFLSSQRLSSEVQVRTDLYPHNLADVPVTHFFGAAGPAERHTGVAAPVPGGNSGGGLEDAVGALLAAAPQPGGVSSDAAAHAVSSRPKQAPPLFALLETAGGSGSDSGSRGTQAAALVAAWAAIALLAHRMLLV